MRAFIILGFLVAAIAGDLSGYSYGPGLSGSASNTVVKTVSSGGSGYDSGLAGSASNTIVKTVGTGGLIGTGGLVSGGLIGGGGLVSGSGLIGGGSRIISSGGLIGGRSGLVSGGLVGSGLVGGGLIGGGLVGGGVISTGGSSIITPGSTTVVGIDAVDSIPQTVEYNKQVFYFSAPDEAQNEGVVTQQLSNVLKKNLQVVFIKAPENNAATNAALQLAKQAIEQRTAIYVLSKENDASQVVGQLQQIQENVPTVPEVRIIKYRTPEDLVHAQQTIQAQYDNFGGPSHLINGGVAPVLNYASGIGSGTVNVLGGGVVGGGLIGGGLVGGGLVGGLRGGYGNVGGGVGVIGRGVGGIGLGHGVTNIIGGGLTTGSYLPPHLKK